jgi:hypothetical protein
MAGERQKLCTAKELAAHFGERGVEVSIVYARALIRACPHSVRGRYVEAPAAWAWWCSHPEWKPFGRRGRPVQGELLA